MFWKQVSCCPYNWQIYSPFLWVAFSLCGRYPLKQVHIKAKETINKMKKQCVEWEKIFENHIFDKRSISKTHEESIKLNSKNCFKNE